jgi:hypothetical protein
MSWKEKMKEFGGGNFTFLSTDGETITFIVVGEPVLLKSMYKKQEQERIGCPIVSEDGYQLFITGKRLARKLSKQEPIFTTNALMVIRHGVEGDASARYDVRVLPEPETFARLVAIRDADFKTEMIQESIDEATAVLGE